jgi:polyisoprenoid-binding protein YceI
VLPQAILREVTGQRQVQRVLCDDDRKERGMTGNDKGLTVRIVVIGLAIAVVGAGALIAWRVFGGKEPGTATLSSPADSGTASGAVDFEGAWTIDPETGSLEDGTSTFAGYRIEEELGGIGTNTAVGRTRNISGTLNVEGTQVTSLEVTVDMTTLASDDERRDGQLADRGLETDMFPQATFVLTEPVEIGNEPAIGEPVSATVTGELTLHGVSRQIEVPIQAQWTGERIEVVASFEVTLLDYDIEAPVGFLVLSIADTGTVEMHVLFRKA